MATFVRLHKLGYNYSKGLLIAINVEQIFTVTPLCEATPQHTLIVAPGDGRNSIEVYESFGEVDRIISGALR